jgi:hypothetical protein
MSSRLKLLAVLVFFVATGCAPRLPSPADFTQAAVGTSMPAGHEESVASNLASDQSGVLLVNQTGKSIQVAVNGTIADIPRAYDFLFSLPPGKHEFYIFEPDRPPYAHTETLEGGKLRYLYITPFGQPGG